MAYFHPSRTYQFETVPQGTIEWFNYPESDPELPALFGARVVLSPGKGHNFHRHPGREELIFVIEGTVEQWVGERCQILHPGDSVLIPAGCVHASFNLTGEEALLVVVLSPVAGDGPLTIEVGDESPWSTIRNPQDS